MGGERRDIEVVAAIIIRDGKVFATQRGYGEFKDKWEFPGGKVEPGESRENALRREIREELDTTVCPVSLLCTVEYDYPAFHLTMHCYLCTITSGSLILKEHEAAGWLSSGELESVDWLPADTQILPAIKACLRPARR